LQEFIDRLYIRIFRTELQIISDKLDQLLMTQDEAVAQLTTNFDQLRKVDTEVQGLKTQIANLEEIIRKGPVSPELETALNNVKGAIQSVDDEVPDVPAANPPQPAPAPSTPPGPGDAGSAPASTPPADAGTPPTNP